MTRILYLFLLLFLPIAAFAQNGDTATAKTVTRLLEEGRQLKADDNLIIYFARQFKGTPYVAHTLEVNDDEQLVVNLDGLDCTTYVETVVALTLCVKQGAFTYNDYRRNLATLRYRDGLPPHYTRRLHYFTDWIENNTAKGLCHEVQSPNPPFTVVQKVNLGYMTAHPDRYKALAAHPEYIADIAAAEQAINGRKYRYIPKASITNTKLMRQTVKDGDIIAFTTKKAGLDISHIGFAVWHSDGLHLLNASSLRKKVVEEALPLREYLKKQTSVTGIRVIRLF